MRLKIITPDGFVSVDDIGYSPLNMDSIASDIHAVQWFDTEGWIEYKEINGIKPENQAITSITQFQIVIDEWNAINYAHNNPPPPTPEENKNAVLFQTSIALDDFARTREYDNMVSLCTYSTSTIPKFSAEGQRGVDLRDSTWEAVYQIIDDAEQGKRAMPTSYDEIKSELPPLVWNA